MQHKRQADEMQMKGKWNGFFSVLEDEAIGHDPGTLLVVQMRPEHGSDPLAVNQNSSAGGPGLGILLR